MKVSNPSWSQLISIVFVILQIVAAPHAFAGLSRVKTGVVSESHVHKNSKKTRKIVSLFKNTAAEFNAKWIKRKKAANRVFSKMKRTHAVATKTSLGSEFLFYSGGLAYILGNVLGTTISLVPQSLIAAVVGLGVWSLSNIVAHTTEPPTKSKWPSTFSH